VLGSITISITSWSFSDRHKFEFNFTRQKYTSCATLESLITQERTITLEEPYAIEKDDQNKTIVGNNMAFQLIIGAVKVEDSCALIGS
jgi:hypothetical protein